MKFDFAIGNPPYQETTESESTRMPPVYDKFMDAAFSVANKVELITPARFLFNTGFTSKAWNEKMLQDKHFKVLEYEPNAANVFPNTDIKGGVVISYRSQNDNYEPIEIFTKYDTLNAILKKVKLSTNETISSIAYPPLSYGLSDTFEKDYPNSIGRLRTSAFTKLSDAFYAKQPDDGNDYIAIRGLLNLKRTSRFIRRDYIVDKNSIVDKWSLILPEASGIGEYGETLGEAEISAPGEAFLQTFVAIGACDNKADAINISKYIKTKFARGLLGVYKTTQHCSPKAWNAVPLQDFTDKSDIDWNTSIKNIDKQLYKKYNLTDEEIEFIETHVKEME